MLHIVASSVLYDCYRKSLAHQLIHITHFANFPLQQHLTALSQTSQLLAVLNFFEVITMLVEYISTLQKQLLGCNIILLNFGRYLIFLIVQQSKRLHILQYLSCVALPSLLLDCYHDVDLRLIGLNPLRKEQVYVADHPALFGKDEEGVLRWVLQPGLVVAELLLE